MARLLALLAVLAMFGGVLAAQQDIDVEYPIGTSVASGSTVKMPDHKDKSPYNLTIRIANVGTGTNLVLDTSSTNRPCTCGGATRVNWLVTQPLTTTLAPAATVDFTLDITPNDNGKWTVFLYIYSDDPDENPYTIRFDGSAGKAKKDESCSTQEDGNFGFLVLIGAVAALGVGIRLKASRA